CLEHLGVTPRISHVLPWQNAFVKGTYLLAVATEAISQALLPGPYRVEGSQHETRQCGNGQVVEIVQYPGKNPCEGNDAYQTAQRKGNNDGESHSRQGLH